MIYRAIITVLYCCLNAGEGLARQETTNYCERLSNAYKRLTLIKADVELSVASRSFGASDLASFAEFSRLIQEDINPKMARIEANHWAKCDRGVVDQKSVDELRGAVSRVVVPDSSAEAQAAFP